MLAADKSEEINLEGVELDNIANSTIDHHEKDLTVQLNTIDINSTAIANSISEFDTTKNAKINENQNDPLPKTITAPGDRDWNGYLGEKAVDWKKSIDKIVEVSTVTRDKLVEASSVARINISKSISVVSNIAAEKVGLLVGKNYIDFAKEEGCNEVTILAGKTTNIPFFVPKNVPIAWKLMVKSFDIGVVVKLREQAEGGAVERDLEPFWKINQDELFVGGRRKVDFDRHFVLVFDNSYSLIRPKAVVYQVLTGDAATLALEQAEFTAKNKLQEEEAAAIAAAEAAKSADSSGKPTPILSSANATVRYVTEGLTPIVSSVVIKVQTASTEISKQAKTNIETIQATKAWSNATSYLSSWVPKQAMKPTEATTSETESTNSPTTEDLKTSTNS